ncbi:MAG: HAD-IC family P-type ATPase [Ferruginibacter sp.]
MLIKLRVEKAPSQSYITQLWNNDIFSAGNKSRKYSKESFIHPWSRYFTIVLFSIAALTAVYWAIHAPQKLWPSVTAVLIVACPCSLLLSATFSFGSMQRIFGKNRLYLKNAAVIESLAGITQIVFDKTGTLTQGSQGKVLYVGETLEPEEEAGVHSVAAQSSHVLSKAIAASLRPGSRNIMVPQQFKETTGSGLAAIINERTIRMGSASYIEGIDEKSSPATKSRVHVKINDHYKGYYEITNRYRPGLQQMASRLSGQGYGLHLLSGDNDSERENIRSLFGDKANILFGQTPQQKLEYIAQCRAKGDRVLMIGDGLNDAGALMQADCGIAVSDDAARFSPACDAIIDGRMVSRLPDLLAYARWNKRIVTAGFVLSILYNIVGISFAVQGKLSPLVAAILMPLSSISIVSLAGFLSGFVAGRLGLSRKAAEEK